MMAGRKRRRREEEGEGGTPPATVVILERVWAAVRRDSASLFSLLFPKDYEVDPSINSDLTSAEVEIRSGGGIDCVGAGGGVGVGGGTHLCPQQRDDTIAKEEENTRRSIDRGSRPT